MIDVDYLDKLAADQIDAGFDLTGADIKSAAVEIRRLREQVKAARVFADVHSNLPENGLLESLNVYVTSHVQHVIDNYDFSTLGLQDADSVRNIVQQMSADGDIESTPDSDQVEDVVRDMIRNGSITIQADIELEC